MPVPGYNFKRNLMGTIHWICLIVSGSVGMTLVFLNGCTGSPQQVSVNGRAEQIIEGFEVRHTVMGRPEWKLTADRARVFEEKSMAMAEQPYVYFYEEGVLSSTMRSDHARLHTDTSDIDAWGEVIIQSKKNGTRLETARVYYRSETGTMVSHEPVTLYRKNSIVTGSGMESAADLSSIIIKNQKVEIINTDEKRENN